MPLSVCQTFTVCSKEILKWQNKQEAVNEESISDWFLYKLNDLNENIRSIQFNRIQEARMTGADFELWVIGHTITHRFRIQAKRLRRGKDHYYGIAYTNEHGRQIEKLLHEANIKNYIPLYAFYNDENLDNRCNYKIKDEGVFVSSAQELYDQIINKVKEYVSSETLISMSIPVSCLFCCPLANGNFDNFFQNYFQPSFHNQNKNGQYDTFNLPNYINSILRENNEVIQKWFFQEFKEITEEVSGVIVVDLRSKNRSNKNRE